MFKKYFWFFIFAIVVGLLISFLSCRYVFQPVTKCCRLTPQQADLLKGYFVSSDYYQNLLKKSQPPIVENNIYGGLVNHHLLAPELVAKVIKTLADKKPQTVILLSPDHFNRGSYLLSSANRDWLTADGILKVDHDLLNKIVDQENIGLDDEAVSKEHGLSNVVGFIAAANPQIKIVPLMIRDGANPEQVAELAAALAPLIDEQTVLLGSFDFSHYLPKNVADFHDLAAENVLENLDSDNVWRLDIDSRPGLALLLSIMKNKNSSFKLFDHSSAADITADDQTFENTSYLTGVFALGDKKMSGFTTLFVGDIFLDRNIRKTISTKGLNYPLQPLERFLSGSDLTIGNLEGPITDQPSRSLGSKIGDWQNTSFTFDPSALPMLKKYGFTTLSLANNHTDNFGVEGLKSSRKYLTENDLGYFGNPDNDAKNLSTIINIRDQKIAVVGYHGIWGQDHSGIITEIKKLRPEVDYLIVYPHWGVEYQDSPSAHQRQTGHDFIEAGADLVVGSHSHVMQPLEIYKNKVIFYGLGNFLFDQNFSAETSESYAVGLSWQTDKISFSIFPLQTVDFQTSLKIGATRQAVWDWLADKSNVSDDLRLDLKSGTFTLENN